MANNKCVLMLHNVLVHTTTSNPLNIIKVSGDDNMVSYVFVENRPLENALLILSLVDCGSKRK